MNDVYTAPLV